MRWRILVLMALSLSGNAILSPSIIADGNERPYGMVSRIPWTTSRIEGTPEPPPNYTVQRAFPKLKFDQPVFIAQEPGTSRFLVAELGGKIFAFTSETPDDASRELFLDTKRQIYAFSFHPRYEENGQIFVFSPTDPEDKREETDRRSRVSRFRASLEYPRKSSADTEEVIIEWLAGGHNGGEAIIGPDGYLYICTGDTTGGSDPKATGQGVNDLYSVMMRLDVENPAEGKAYSIPPDNPFINYPDACPEIWAFGFRNPWRMSFDEKSGDLWVGDVGQDLWEMVRLVRKGENYGWSVQEGNHPFHPENPIGPGPIIPPVIEHHHTECRSITGGYVYHGPKFPELQGAYFYGDYEYGQVWALRYDGKRVTWKDQLADSSLRIASFGVGRDGEIYLIDHPTGELYTLERAPEQIAGRPFPRKLSETGMFHSVSENQVAEGLIPYSVNAPQWVDGGHKVRFAGIPGELKVDFTEDSKSMGAWSFPDGTVHMETISFDLESSAAENQGDINQSKRIETRILVRQQNHWLGYSYLWNDEQTDAELVGARGMDLQLSVADDSVPGGKRQQTWRVPSRDECMACHSRAAGFVLGFSTAQMNREYDYHGVRDNQLRAWDHIGMFSKPIEKKPDEYFAMPNPYGTSEESNAKARAWLQVNCSVCHVADGGGNAKLEVNFSRELKDAKLVNERPLHGTFDLTDARLVAPGDPFASVLFYRLSKLGRGRMPHVSSRQHDEQGLKLIHDWIRNLPPVISTTASTTQTDTKPLADAPEGSSEETELAAVKAAELKKAEEARKSEENRIALASQEAITAEAAKRSDAEYQSVLNRLEETAKLANDEQAVAMDEILASTRTAFIAAYALSEHPEPAAWKESLINAAMAHPNANVRDLFERFVPEEKRIQRLGELFDPHSVLALPGDPERGRQLFFGNASQCRNCHRVKQEGGNVGPELTEIGKKLKPEELLEAVAEPSRRIDQKYIGYSLLTTEGKVYSGILAEKSGSQVVLNILQGNESQQVRVPTSEVEELVPQTKSIMPDRMMRDMTIQQAADLIAYLSSLK
jgi:uncharacterized repeat protein (TIGR03806 family)